ncbi:MAG: glycosyltransferase family 2 protein [bacterium]|nr:glycosyltransferase family 2 protein [bacterium]
MRRLFEWIPGTLSWGTLIALFVFSWSLPAATAIFIILFDIYWLLKTVYFSLHLRVSFRKMRENMKIDWLARVCALPAEEKKEGNVRWDDVCHLIILPMYRESYEVVHESIASLAVAHYPQEKMLVVLATEAAAPEGQDIADRIRHEFEGMFGAFLVTVHPAGIASEIPGKGSNEAWAGREAQRVLIDGMRIPYERVLVSVFDADTQVLPEYFGILTYQFLTVENPQRTSYQPIPLFTNNIFTAPLLARVIAFSSSFWHMIQQSRPERLTTFSSHAMPFKALTEVGFWNRAIVSEDSQIFWQCYLHYGGDWRVVPILYPVSMDANVAPKFWTTMKNLYKQQRRWAWGCENIPYFLCGFMRNKKISLRKKFYWSFHIIEGFHSWATNAVMIFLLGWLPVALGGSTFQSSVLSYNLPRITRIITSLAILGITSSAILSILLLPPKPVWFRRRHYVLYFVQWLMLPVTLIIFGAIPALEAQTRLLIGGCARLGFWVTPKFRKKESV